MKKLLGVLLVLIVFAVVPLLVSCANEKVNVVDANQVTVVVDSEPEEGFDPCLGWGLRHEPLIQSTLLATDAKLNITYDLATEYTISDDGLTWTLKLRDDAVFSDGQPVTSQDVVFTYKTAQESGSLVDLSQMVDCVVVDDYVVEFKLTEPRSTFAYTLASLGIVPEHAYSADYANNPIGSGPYKLLQWDKGQQVILEANEFYYGEKPQIGRVIVLFMSEEASFAAAKSGTVDVAYTAANLASQQVENMNLEKVQTIDNRGLCFPMLPAGSTDENGNPVGNDVTCDKAIRQAFAYGIDKQILVDDVIHGFATPAYSECDGMPWYNKEDQYAYDFEKAQQILADGGWVMGEDGVLVKDGLKAEFNLIYEAGNSSKQALANAVAVQAKKMGINITLSELNWDDTAKRMYSEAVLFGWGNQTPLELYSLYHSDNIALSWYNPNYYANDTVDSYMDEALVSTDVVASYDLWKKAQWDGVTGYAVEGDCPWVWLVNVDHLYFVRSGLNIGEQKIHAHGTQWAVLENLSEWTWQ